tara:strand:- start:35 stop:628 length:594 start_codon:yes stop_codon:yes gene_type:complete
MNNFTNESELDEALENCDSGRNSIQAHGLLCGYIMTHGLKGHDMWLHRMFENSSNEKENKYKYIFDDLFIKTWRQLEERQSKFELFLPGDDRGLLTRAKAIGSWCDSYLHGLISSVTTEKLKKAINREPTSILIKDLLEMTKATIGEEDDDETNERSYAELVEYTRIAVQLIFEELDESRNNYEERMTTKSQSDLLQ